MELRGLWGESVPSDIEDFDNIYDGIDELLNMLDFSYAYDTLYYIDENIYDKNIDGDLFANWLYDNSDIELRDIKKELYKKLCKAKSVDCLSEEESLELENCSGKFYIKADNKDIFNIWSISEYLNFKRYVLANMKSKSLFCENLEECFVNIFFDDTVHSSIGTLNNNFDDLKKEIVFHLSKLNDYHDKFSEYIEDRRDYKSVCNNFKIDTGIECSPQAGRNSVKLLNRAYYNSITDEREVLCCELHTKFNNYNRDRTKQDRIYFHPGRMGVNDGKIIIIHIGRHL